MNQTMKRILWSFLSEVITFFFLLGIIIIGIYEFYVDVNLMALAMTILLVFGMSFAAGYSVSEIFKSHKSSETNNQAMT
jgi:hypothetical protein